MAASLDKLEGELVEGIGLALLVVLVVLAYLAWKAVGSLDPTALMNEMLRLLKQWWDKLALIAPGRGGHAWPWQDRTEQGSVTDGGESPYDVRTGIGG